MGHVDHLHLEWTDLGHLTERDVYQGNVAQLVLIQLRADHPDRERPAVDDRGDAEFTQHVRQRPHMILVSMGEHDALDVFRPVPERAEVRQDEIYPEHLRGREHDSTVDQDDLPLGLDRGHVLAYLPQSAEREYA